MKGGTRKRGKTWSYYFDAAQVGGSRKKIEKGGFRTKKEAEAALAKALTEYDNSGQLFTPSEISVSDYLDLWMDQYCKMNLSYKTVETYASLIKNHLKPEFGHYHLKSIQTAAVQAYINRLKTEGYAKSTIEVILTILSSSMDYAIEPLQYIKDNPCDRIRIGKIHKPPRERIVLTDAQFKGIQKIIPAGDRFHLPILIGWNCGTRINECIGLTWDDIDFDTLSMRIDRQIIRRGVRKTGIWLLKEPKYDSRRTIKFGETLAAALKAERKRQLENELLYGEFYTVYYLEDYTDDKGHQYKRLVETTKGNLGDKQRFHLICTDENGSRVTVSQFQHCAAKIKTKLEIPFDYHCLRHTHATRLIEAKVNIKAVQVRLGHRNIATTLNTYVHNTDDMAQEAADIFEATVNGLPPK